MAKGTVLKAMLLNSDLGHEAYVLTRLQRPLFSYPCDQLALRKGSHRRVLPLLGSCLLTISDRGLLLATLRLRRLFFGLAGLGCLFYLS